METGTKTGPRPAPRLPSLLECGLFLLAAVGLMYGMLTPAGLDLNNQAKLLGATAPLFVLLCLVTAMACRLGHSFASLEAAMRAGIGLAMPAVLILVVVGGLIGVWSGCGTISTLIHYGLDVLSPGWFLPATLVLCSVVSLACGSSWTTASTAGVALIGIGTTLGFAPAMVAGAVISGAYFGDKISPLSDTTNLAPAIAGTTLFAHVHSMLYTTLPAWLIALGLYAWLGADHASSGAAQAADIAAMQATLASLHTISPWLLLPPVVVLVLAVTKQPALPSLVAGIAVAALLELFVQRPAGTAFGAQLQVVCLQVLDGFTATTDNKSVNDLLTGGGMSSMLGTILMITIATAMGGVLEKARYLEVLMTALQRLVKRPAGLVTATICASTGSNALLSDQYLAIVLPGRLFRDAYPKFGLSPRVLSRSLEDAGTLTSPLVPWNSCGAFMAGTLGVLTIDYLPYAFLNLLNPLIAILFAWIGFAQFKYDPAKDGPVAPPPSASSLPPTP